MSRHVQLTLMGLGLGIITVLAALVLQLPVTSPLIPPPPNPVRATGTTTPLTVPAQALISVYQSANGPAYLITSKNSDQALPIASITKLVTALTALRLYKLEDVLTVTKNDILPERDPAFFRPGDTFTVKDLFYPLLVESSNNAAMILAHAKNEELFVKAMNTTSHELGMEQAKFYNPSGLDPMGGKVGVNVASAADIARLGSYLALSRPDLLSITTLQGYQLFTATGQFHHALTNTDQLLSYQGWPAEIVGGKTGTTDLAGRNLLLILKDNKTGGYLINVVLGTDDHFRDMRTLIDWVYANYTFSK